MKKALDIIRGKPGVEWNLQNKVEMVAHFGPDGYLKHTQDFGLWDMN
jgi:hypothetical protein